MEITTHEETAQVFQIKLNVRTNEFENRAKFQAFSIDVQK